MGDIFHPCLTQCRREVGEVGAPHLAACGGKVFWELRVKEAKGFVIVGFAGTNIRTQKGGNMLLGDDEAARAIAAIAFTPGGAFSRHHSLCVNYCA